MNVPMYKCTDMHLCLSVCIHTYIFVKLECLVYDTAHFFQFLTLFQNSLTQRLQIFTSTMFKGNFVGASDVFCSLFQSLRSV